MPPEAHDEPGIKDLQC